MNLLLPEDRQFHVWQIYVWSDSIQSWLAICYFGLCRSSFQSCGWSVRGHSQVSVPHWPVSIPHPHQCCLSETGRSVQNKVNTTVTVTVQNPLLFMVKITITQVAVVLIHWPTASAQAPECLMPRHALLWWISIRVLWKSSWELWYQRNHLVHSSHFSPSRHSAGVVDMKGQ